MWGAQEKSGGTSKKFPPTLRAGIVPPHLQIASDATHLCAREKNFSHIFETIEIDLSIHCTTCSPQRSTEIEFFAKIVFGPELKIWP